MPVTAITKEEENLCRYYHMLLVPGESVPSSNDYMPFGEWLDVSTEMFIKRSEGGVPSLEEYIASLSKIKDKKHKRLVTILSTGSLEQTSETYAGKLLSEVIAQKQSWLWKPRLALGKITTLDGDPGLGKSIIGVDLGSRITTGRDMPDGSPSLAKGGVVVIMPEDGLEDTIQPRFARAGADLSKVVDLSTIKTDEGDRPFTLPYDLNHLEAAIRRVDAKMVYIDPIMAVIGGSTNTYKDNEVRALLMPLKTLVERYRVSCVIVRHMVKARGENPIMAGGGSIAFVGLARTGLMVVRNPENPEQTIFSHIKSNIGPIASGIAYSVCSDEEQGDDRPYVVWGEVTSISGLDLMNPPRKNTGSNRQEILDLLKEKAPSEMSIQEISEALPEMTLNNIRVTLTRMLTKGEIAKSERDAYHAK